MRENFIASFLRGSKKRRVFINVIIVCGFFLSIISLLSADIISVPADYPTIQAAIDAAQYDDEIIVSPGTYYENIDFLGKNIILRSVDPQDSSIVAGTVINGLRKSQVVTFSGDETPDCLLEGFTIVNGYAYWGGAIVGHGTLATIQYNIFNEHINGALYWCHGTIQHNTITYNTGDGLYLCNGTIQYNNISHNRNSATYRCDGTIQNNIMSFNYISGVFECDGTIQNNTIYKNSGHVTAAGGIYDCHGDIRNNIVWGNSAGQVTISETPSYCCIQNWTGGGTGNITTPPGMVDPDNGDFHLLPDSPCVDAGMGITGLHSDFEGDYRPIDGTSEPRGDGSDYDIGADEFTSTVLAVYSFDDDSAGWTFHGAVDGFDVPLSSAGSGHIGLSPDGSYNSFSYWHSPDCTVQDGVVYRSHWTITSDATTPDEAVQYRLRANQKGSWSAWERTTNSNLYRAPSSMMSKEHDLWFCPTVSGAGNDSVVFSFDIMSFDALDQTDSWLFLESLTIEEIPGILDGKFLSEDIMRDSTGWTFTGKISPFDEPLSSTSSGNLGLCPDGSSYCFSYWRSPGFTIEDGILYRVIYVVGTDAPPDEAVQFRVRVIQQNTWTGWGRIVHSNFDHAPSTGNSKSYTVLFTPEVTGVLDDTAICCLDIMSFNPADDTSSWLFLEDVLIEEIPSYP